MADNVAVTPGSGATVAADEVSGALWQRLKIGHGADGSATDVSTASPLPVRKVGAALVVAPTITAGGYSAKDVIGGLLTFTNAVRATGGKGIVKSVTITDLAFVANVLRLWLFDTAPTTIADNAALDILDAELPTLVGVIPIAAADYFQATDNQVACVRGIGLQYTCTGTSLYGYLDPTGTPTYASTSDLTITLEVEYLD